MSPSPTTSNNPTRRNLSRSRAARPLGRTETVATEFVFADASPIAISVGIIGDWDGWRTPHVLHREQPGLWSGVIRVTSGTHSFRFVEDGRIVLSPRHPIAPGGTANIRNILAPPIQRDAGGSTVTAWQRSQLGVKLHRWLVHALLRMGIVTDGAAVTGVGGGAMAWMDYNGITPDDGLPGPAVGGRKGFSKWVLQNGYVGLIVAAIASYLIFVVVYVIVLSNKAV